MTLSYQPSTRGAKLAGQLALDARELRVDGIRLAAVAAASACGAHRFMRRA